MGSCFFFLPMAEATSVLNLDSLGLDGPLAAAFSPKFEFERFKRKDGGSLDFERDHHDLFWPGGANDIGGM